MTIKTNIFLEDYTAFVKYVAGNTGSGDKVIRACASIAVGLGIAVIVSFTGFSRNVTVFTAMIGGVIAGAFLVTLVISIIGRQQMRRMQPADDGYILGEREIFVTDEGIQQTAENHQALFKWPLVRHIEITKQHIFIMVDRNAAVIVSKRDFSSEAECEQFISGIQKRCGTMTT